LEIETTIVDVTHFLWGDLFGFDNLIHNPLVFTALDWYNEAVIQAKRALELLQIQLEAFEEFSFKMKEIGSWVFKC